MFFSVTTKNLNWKILTKNLGTLKNGMRLRIKNFNIMRFTEKFNFRGGFPKKQYIGWNCLKRGELRKFADLRGAWQKEGGGVFKGS